MEEIRKKKKGENPERGKRGQPGKRKTRNKESLFSSWFIVADRQIKQCRRTSHRSFTSSSLKNQFL